MTVRRARLGAGARHVRFMRAVFESRHLLQQGLLEFTERILRKQIVA